MTTYRPDGQVSVTYFNKYQAFLKNEVYAAEDDIISRLGEDPVKAKESGPRGVCLYVPLSPGPAAAQVDNTRIGIKDGLPIFINP